MAGKTESVPSSAALISSARRRLSLALGAFPLCLGEAGLSLAAERRNDVSFLRGPYQLAFYRRHNLAYRLGAGMHFFHSKQHDLLQLTPLARHEGGDERFEQEALNYLRKLH